MMTAPLPRGAELSRRLFLGTAAAGAAHLLTGCGGDDVAWSEDIAIACGEQGGIYIEFGDLLADLLESERVTGKASALETDGSVENIAWLKSGRAALAIALADSAVASGWQPQAIGRVYQNCLQCVVLAGSPVTRAADLAGRTVSVGSPGSGTALTSLRVLDALGVGGDGPRGAGVVNESLSAAARRLVDGDLDAFIFSGGIPTPAISDLAARQPIRVLDLADGLPSLNQRYDGVYQSTFIPRDTYALASDVPAIGVSNLLLSRPDLPDSVAGRLVDVLIDRARDLIPEPSSSIQYLTAQGLIDTGPLALHRGASARYRERHG